VRDLLSAIVVISPDSMTVERSVSTYNILYSKLRTTTNQKTLNDRMIIAWNGVPTASYDPRPAVVSFFNKKERRNARPCLIIIIIIIIIIVFIKILRYIRLSLQSKGN
jgi:t-SNARE complex subunit (syntaxin)